jgi:type I restriction enzyme R subunit
MEEIIAKFEPADLRQSYEYDFKMFSYALDEIMPQKEADPYLDDFKFASKIRQILRTYYEGVKPSTRPYAKKIQNLIDDHIRSLHISELINPMEVTYENFLAFVKKKVKSDRAKTALIKNKAIMVIEELKSNNPAYYERLRERLQRIIDEENDRRQKNASYFANPELYEQIYKEALDEEKERKKVFGNYEATQIEFAIYGELDQIIKDKKKSISLTKSLYSKLKPETEIVGWKTKTSTEKKLMATIYDTLIPEIPEDKTSDISDRIITLMKNKL